MIRNQTIAIGICSLIILCIMIINTFTQSKDKSVFDKANIVVIGVIFVVILPLTLVKLYAVNCMLEGNCDLLVNILVGAAIVITLIYLIMFISKVIKQKKKAAVIDEEKKH